MRILFPENPIARPLNVTILADDHGPMVIHRKTHDLHSVVFCLPHNKLVVFQVRLQNARIRNQLMTRKVNVLRIPCYFTFAFDRKSVKRGRCLISRRTSSKRAYGANSNGESLVFPPSTGSLVAQDLYKSPASQTWVILIRIPLSIGVFQQVSKTLVHLP
jgi:hypothetical protein